MSDDKHDCPKIGCSARLPFETLACRPHWFALPPTLRASIQRAWRSGDLPAIVARRAEAVAFLNGGGHP